jgi:Flp pilus assembly pilin Flp
MKDALSPAKAGLAQLDEAYPMRPRYQRLIFKLQCLIRREGGQDMVEYALLLALIVAFLVASVGAMSAPITAMLNKVTTTL